MFLFNFNGVFQSALIKLDYNFNDDAEIDFKVFASTGPTPLAFTAVDPV